MEVKVGLGAKYGPNGSLIYCLYQFRLLLWCCFTLLSSIVMVSTATASTLPTLNVSDLSSSGLIHLNGHAQIYREDKQFDLDTLLSNPALDWQPTPEHNSNFGQSKHPVWFRIQLSHLDQVNTPYFLRLRYPHLDRVHVYFVDKSGSFQDYITGDTVPFVQRPVDDRIFLFPLHQLNRSQIDVYIEVFTEGPLRVPLDLVTRPHLDKDEKYSFGLYGLYFGIMLVMFFYNFFIYLVVRNTAYLYYLFYVASTTFLQFALLGFGFEWLWPESTTLNNHLLLIFTNLVPLSALLFATEFMMINRFGISWHIWSIRLLLLIFGLDIVFAPFGPYMTIFQISHLTTFVLVFFIFYLGISYWRKGISTARNFTLVWFIYLVFLIIYLMEITGIYRAGEFAKNALLIGSAIEITMFSIAFGDQINEQKEQISKLLSTTKALSQSTSKVHAGAVALANLANMSRHIYLNDANLFLPQQSSHSLLRYPLWIDGHTQLHPNSYEATENMAQRLKQLDTTTLINQELFIPIKSDKKVWGYLQISKYRAKSSYLVLELDLIESVIHSLAHTMESMTAEENDRMSMIGSMAAAIVHDLKNPIGAIQGCAELAKDEDISKDEKIGYLNSIIAESKHMDIMAHEILEFSSGHLVLNIKEHPAREFIKEMSQILQQVFRSANIQYEEHCEVDAGIKMDAERIRRVLLNLATNARDAMAGQHDGNAKFILTIKKEGDDIVFVAEDNGPGIPQAIQANLFEPFVTYGKKDGTGLGMAITKRIVDTHLGQIKFNSSATGTTFTVVLPNAYTELTTVDSIENETTSHDELNFNNLSVLLAEDNPVNQTIISRVLRKWKMHVEVVSNGLQAIEQIKSRHFDMVLMDLEMPELDGFEATKIIRKQNQFAQLPIIALTGHTTENEMKKCLSAGVNTIVQKPIDRHKLAEAMQGLL